MFLYLFMIVRFRVVVRLVFRILCGIYLYVFWLEVFMFVRVNLLLIKNFSDELLNSSLSFGGGILLVI